MQQILCNMADVKCEECGTVIPNGTNECPNCGCPQPVSQEEYNAAGYYYVDFNWFEKFSSDPKLLTWLIDVKWLRWFCAPWHIGENNNGRDYQIANDIFFIINRFWKLFVYPNVWAFCKGWWIFLLSSLLVLFGGGIVYLVFYFWFMWIGLGKSCHRYGIPMIRCIRHLINTIARDIKENINN